MTDAERYYSGLDSRQRDVAVAQIVETTQRERSVPFAEQPEQFDSKSE